MRMSVIDKKTRRAVSQKSVQLSVNPFNGQIYDRHGSNVSDRYEVSPKVDKSTPEDLLRVRVGQLERYERVVEFIRCNMADLNCSDLKALIVVLLETVAKDKGSATIENERFIEAGKGLSRRDFVGKATKKLVADGLISKVKFDDHVFMYSPKMQAVPILCTEKGVSYV